MKLCEAGVGAGAFNTGKKIVLGIGGCVIFFIFFRLVINEIGEET